MKRYWIILTTIALLTKLPLATANFEVKIKPNSVIPNVDVYSNDPSLIHYNHSRQKIVDYEVEVRGRCPTPGAKLIDFKLMINNQKILDIPVSGNNRALTGNNGNQWDSYSIRSGFQADNETLINACNLAVNKKFQNQSLDQILNSNFITAPVDTGKSVEILYDCFGGVGFSDIFYDSTHLPIKAFCEATGYRSQLLVSDSNLTLHPVSGRDGTCKLNISGEFRTNYELYSHRSKKSTAPLRYRFKYQSSGNSPHTEYSQWWDKTANPINAGMFVFNYTDRLPASITNGKVSLQVKTDGKIQTAASKNFSINCTEALPLQQTGNLQLKISVVADPSKTIVVGNQLCPTHAIVSGQLKAGYPIRGNMIFMGSSLADLYVSPIDLDAGQRTTERRRVKLNWPSAANTLSLNGGTPSTALKKQTLQYGLRVTNSNAEVVKSLSKKPFTLSCEYPSVNPILPAVTTLGMIPDHTGGGGAPTSMQGKSPFTRQADNHKSINAGLRSDGELVQARKPLNLLSHELSHTGQQGRMLMDADTNEMNSATQHRQNKNVPPSPTQIPYPTFGGKKSNTVGTDNWPQRKKIIGLTGKPNSQGAKKDSLDRFANQQFSQQSTQQAHTIPLQDATIAAVRSEQLNRGRDKKTTLFKGKIGSRCKKNRFPKNVVINHSGRQRAVECINGRVVINRTKKVQQPWRTGDPVLHAPGIEKGPKQEFRPNPLRDEMLDDLPPG